MTITDSQFKDLERERERERVTPMYNSSNSSSDRSEKGVTQGKKRMTQGKESEHSLISRASCNVSQSSIVIHAKHAASKAAVVSKKLLRSTSKAAWIIGTTFLILAVPLIIEMDHDQKLTEIELQNPSLFGTAPTPK